MMFPRRPVALAFRTSLITFAAAFPGVSAATSGVSPVPATFKEYCFGCHGKAASMAGLNLEDLASRSSIGENFQHWEKVANALEQKRMPPAKMRQPDEGERSKAISWIRASLKDYARKHAGDPGRVTVRRLTNGEYGYAIQDLTGLSLDFERDFSGDSVGGEGFTNFGDVQFVDDAAMERYLEAAKRVADHAVIGAGPLGFFQDAGKSGFELSAVSRIQQIYQAYGFRAVAGEGGKPYGLDRYSKAFYAAWYYRHRRQLGEPTITLEKLARRERLTPAFVRHIWLVINQPSPTYPTSEIVTRWRALPAPLAADPKQPAVRTACDKIQAALIEWPRWLFAAGELAAGGAGDERALLLSEASVQAKDTNRFKFFVRPPRGQKMARVHLSVVSVNPKSNLKPLVLWRNATVQFRKADRSAGGAPKSLRDVLTADSLSRIGWTGETDTTEFSTTGDRSFFLDIDLPADAAAAEIQLEASIAPGQPDEAIVRCILADQENLSKARVAWVLLAQPDTPGYRKWKSGVLEFAENLPQNSHGEPTPSDKDEIPAPFNNAYNQPERDLFHSKLKYYRTDRFFVEKMLDSATRVKLDQAWNDLLASFEYHDIFLRFVADKYKIDLKKKGIGDLTDAEVAKIPAEPQKFVRTLRGQYLAVMASQSAAQRGHVEDALEFATKAWRRPLPEAEKGNLRAFYKNAVKLQNLDHDKAIRALLARILVAPAFLYRLEQPSQAAGARMLSNFELASRLGFFLWSSVPDQELRRAAATGALADPKHLELQVKRMLADPKARRFSTEFFGQWLGFYRFDQYRGVDPARYPEFTDEIKSAMYDEAVSFFEHIVRKDRPVRDVLFADYTFLNRALAKHYGVKHEITSTEPQLVNGANEFKRGGVLRLGALLTATSAPLRTSPVKRGDWVLRRILGTPTPPPPADAGSLPADDKHFDGLSVRDRLAAHQRNATCAACHSRIDPMGFPLERFDAVGRVRDKYSDGRPIEDSIAMANKTELSGVDGLLAYLKTQEQQVLKNLSNKLVGYALGRTVLASDQPLIESMTKGGYDVTFSKLITDIVTSKQFRYRRERHEGGPATPAYLQTLAPPAVKTPEKEGGL